MLSNVSTADGLQVARFARDVIFEGTVEEITNNYLLVLILNILGQRIQFV